MGSRRPQRNHRLAFPRIVSQESHQRPSEIHNGDQFATVERNGLVMAAEFEPLLRATHLDSIDRLFADDLGERLDKPGLASWRQRRRLSLNGDGGPTFFVKTFDHPPFRVRRLIRAAKTGARSVAGTEWSWLQRLRDDGIACPQPVALGEELAGRKEIRSVLMTQAVPGRSLERWMLRWNELDPVTRGEIAGGVARLVSKLHQRGYAHRDLYLSHIFYNHAQHGDESLCLIDLQRVIRPRWRRVRWIVKDLASLNFSSPVDILSRTGRLRWLLVYLGTEKLDAAGRRLAYRVLGKTARIARKEARRRTHERSGEPMGSQQVIRFGSAGSSARSTPFRETSLKSKP